MWSVVTMLLRAESTLAVYAGAIFALAYVVATGWFTYEAFFINLTESTTTDAE